MSDQQPETWQAQLAASEQAREELQVKHAAAIQELRDIDAALNGKSALEFKTYGRIVQKAQLTAQRAEQAEAERAALRSRIEELVCEREDVRAAYEGCKRDLWATVGQRDALRKERDALQMSVLVLRGRAEKAESSLLSADARGRAQGLKEAWEAGFKLAVRYGNNWAHWDGVQKEREWAAFLRETGQG